MPKIVVLDGYTLNPLPAAESSPDHPSWHALATLGDLTIHERSTPADIPARIADAEIVLTNKAPLSRETISSLPHLKYIGVMATGTNIVDLKAASEHGIVVTNVPGYSTMSVAQHVFALILELCSQVGPLDREVKSGRWQACPDFCFTVAPLHELDGKTLGIVGLGAIGQAVARIGVAFGMKIIATARSPKQVDFPVDWVSTEDLLRRADVVSLHCPLTPETHHLINAKTLAGMKPSALLINTGRGPLVEEQAVAAALEAGQLGGYGGDVLLAEPPVHGSPLISAPRSVLTPHVAWASVEARQRLMDALVGNVKAFLSGIPSNVVNSPVRS
ncbi:glycerate dehydrogenase [Terrimicrobium sacchariphilum]|uniref:Glycerate dehydrogenase n=1 Tax=Terrimicrobium sacchariphilum TaxID=690879 RepID=A0A146GA12_TERSA|nr:D-2-hydroxyacid dehydrogenase [Terrimicrobium sacchariphilum]GAT33426.1 glycerate dehydrogenase [Terrimicrobium sacchariphilum]